MTSPQITQELSTAAATGTFLFELGEEQLPESVDLVQSLFDLDAHVVVVVNHLIASLVEVVQ